jgi:long-chain acyl-CoA synthetase
VNRAIQAKKKALKNGGRTPVYDRLVFNTMKNKLGGNLYFILCGSAPLAPVVHELFYYIFLINLFIFFFNSLQVCIGATIFCGYSLTETSCFPFFLFIFFL